MTLAARDDTPYLALVHEVIDHGVVRGDRTGTGTRSLHGATLRFDLSAGRVPLLTTKKVPWQGAIVELLWFLSGDTSIRPLLTHNVHIWTDWPMAKYRQATGEAITRADFEARVLADPAFEAQ